MTITFSGNGLLTFPTKEEIIEHLRGHYLTCEENYPSLTQKKIIETIALNFANTREYPLGLKNSVLVVLSARKLSLPDTVMKVMRIHLIIALFYCASGRENYKCFVELSKPQPLREKSYLFSIEEPHPDLPKKSYSDLL